MGKVSDAFNKVAQNLNHVFSYADMASLNFRRDEEQIFAFFP